MSARKPYPDVVVLLPGITGSELANDEGVIWGWSGRVLVRNLLSAGAALDRDLPVSSDSPVSRVLDDGVRATRLLGDLHLIPGVWKVDGYGSIQYSLNAGIEDLEVSRANFLPFPYDWRRDNRAAAHRLKEEATAHLAAWRISSGNRNAKLILVAHSMGGLVARYFLEVLEGWRDTRALITFGTPYSGSMNAVDSLVNGIRQFGLDLTNTCRSMISLHQLLPTYECCDSGNGAFTRIRDLCLPGINAAHLANATAFHDEIRTAAARNKDDENYRKEQYGIFPVVGYNQPTRNTFRVAGDGVELLETLGDSKLSGDGTVPRLSATPDEFNAAQSMFASARHGELQNLPAALLHLGGVLSTLALLPKGRGDGRDGVKLPVRVSLAVDDVYRAGDPIVVRARPSSESSLLMTVTDRERKEELIQRRMPPGSDGWHTETFEIPRAGLYSVHISGNRNVEQVSDVIEVLDREAA